MKKNIRSAIYWGACAFCFLGILKVIFKPDMKLWAHTLDVHIDHRAIEREGKLRIERSEAARKADARQKVREAEQKKAEHEKKKRQEEENKKEEKERKERLAELKRQGELLQKILKRK